MAALHAADAGVLQLDRDVDVTPADYVSARQHSPIRDRHPSGTRTSIRELLRLAVSESDGSASDVLLRLAGGPPRVMSCLRGIGVHDLIVATTEQAMGRDDAAQFRNWATPAGGLSLLRAVYQGPALSDSSRSLLTALLTNTTSAPGRIRGLLPTNTVVAHKTGSSGIRNGVAATNDIGIVTLPDGRQLAIAVLLTNATTSDATLALTSQIASSTCPVRPALSRSHSQSPPPA
jgi:beta-lactamase class A